MVDLRSASFEPDLNRVARAVVSGLAVFLALRVTDGVFTSVGATFLFLFVLTVPWAVADRLFDRSRDS